VFVLNVVLLKVPGIDLMRGMVVCAVHHPLRLAQCGHPAGVGKATTRHGVGFHGAVTISTTRRRPAVALTSGDSFHGTTTASGGVDQRQRLPHHGKGQRRRRPTATASTSRRRPAATVTSDNDFHVTAKASGGVDQRQPDNNGLGSRPHGLKSGLMSFFIFKN
jgi:hypothetical protein